MSARPARGEQSPDTEHERAVSRLAHPAVERDQLLERAALVKLGVVEAVDHDVGDVGEAVRAPEMAGRRR